MNEALAPGLAVAILTETDQSVWPYRRASDRPLTGYALLTRNGHELKVFMLMENGRTLHGRTIGESFYYEGWLLTNSNPVSLGAFNAGPGGEANAEVGLTPADASPSSMRGVRVTAEPFGGSLFGYRPVLQGELIWLSDQETAAPWQSPEQPRPEPLPGRSEPEWPEPMLPEPEQPQWPEPLPEQEPMPEQPEKPVRAAVIARSAAPDGWDAEFVMVSALGRKPPQAHPVNIGEPAVDMGQMQTGPSTPGAAKHGLVRVTLAARHPLAPRGGGTGQVDYGTGRISLNLRGLPSPPSLGRESSTDRPFNAYRVWLVGSSAGTRMPLGLCTRVWGENWRFESDAALPLARYDAVLVTVDDRSASAFNPSAPQVLLGGYGTGAVKADP